MRYLFEGGELGCVLDVPEAGALGGQLLADALVLGVLRRQDQGRVVAQLPQVLQRLRGHGQIDRSHTHTHTRGPRFKHIHADLHTQTIVIMCMQDRSNAFPSNTTDVFLQRDISIHTPLKL